MQRRITLQTTRCNDSGDGMNVNETFKQLDALTASLRELNLRRDAQRMGCSYWTRCKMADASFTASNQKPWRKLPKRTARLFERMCKRRRTR